MTLRVVLIAVACAACAGCKAKDRPGPSEASCRQACEHVLDLARADLEQSLARMGDLADEVGAGLRAQAEASTATDLATCTTQCQAGKLDPVCALAARTIDGAMTCAGSAYGGGGQPPVEPPRPRREADWPEATLRLVADEIGGVSFTFRLPAELAEQPADRSAESRGWDVPGEPFSQPRFRMDLGPAFPATLEEAMAYFAPSDRHEVLRQELAGDRATLIYATATYVVAKVLIRAGDRSLECFGTHSSSAGLAEPARLGTWLADVCATVRVE